MMWIFVWLLIVVIHAASAAAYKKQPCPPEFPRWQTRIEFRTIELDNYIVEKDMIIPDERFSRQMYFPLPIEEHLRQLRAQLVATIPDEMIKTRILDYQDPDYPRYSYSPPGRHVTMSLFIRVPKEFVSRKDMGL